MKSVTQFVLAVMIIWYKSDVKASSTNQQPCVSYRVSATPDVSEKYYFERGDMIKYKVVGYHNVSANAGVDIDRSAVIHLSSGKMTFDASLVLSEEKATGTIVNNANNTDDGGLVLVPGTLESTNQYTAYVNATVKDDVNALDSLYVRIEYSGNEHEHEDSCGGTANSDPIVYVEHPTLNLTQSIEKDFIVNDDGGPIDYELVLTMPKFSMNASVEITSASGDFVFMTLSDATVVEPIGTDLSIPSTPQPVYSSADATLGNTAVKFDFGLITVNTPHENIQIRMEFKVTVHDHVMLVNGTKHDIVAGIEGSRTVEIVRLCGTVVKIEPRLVVNVTHDGFSDATQLFIGDTLNVSVIVSHADDSTANAIDGWLTLTFKYVKLIDQSNSFVVHNESMSAIGNVTLDEFNTFSWVFEVIQDVSPLALASFDLRVDYKNEKWMDKIPVHFATATNIGTPSLTMTPATSADDIRPGQSICFKVVAVFDKIKSAAKFKFFAQHIDGKAPLFDVKQVKISAVGSNVIGVDTSAIPYYESTDSRYTRITDTANLDLGIGLNNKTGDVDENRIELQYCVVLCDHSDVTNGSQYWVGVAMSDVHMIIIHQQLVTTSKPYQGRPILEARITTNASSVVRRDVFSYVITIFHTAASSQFAHNLSLTVFFPMYIAFESMIPETTTYEMKNHFLTIKYPGVMPFLTTFEATLEMRVAEEISLANIETSNFAGIAHASYRSSAGKKFIASSNVKMQLTNASREFKVETMPIGCKKEYCEYGIAKAADKVYVWFGQGKDSSDNVRRGCYVTNEGEDSWKKMTSKIGSILGTDTEGNLYGVSEDCKSYMKRNKESDRWLNLSDENLPSDVDPQFKKIEGSFPADLPLNEADILLLIATHKYAATGDGLYVESNGSWNKQLSHSCSQCG